MQDNPKEMLPLVDEDGHCTGTATRAECHSGSKLLHPVVHLHLYDTAGRLYLQKRPLWKDIQPGKYDTSTGGHMAPGESVREALRREVREELGITEFEPEHLYTYIFESDRERELVNVFRAVTAEMPRPSDELDGGCFMSSEEIESAIRDGLLTPNFVHEYRTILGSASNQK